MEVHAKQIKNTRQPFHDVEYTLIPLLACCVNLWRIQFDLNTVEISATHHVRQAHPLIHTLRPPQI
jgi:hypothetical protein